MGRATASYDQPIISTKNAKPYLSVYPEPLPGMARAHTFHCGTCGKDLIHGPPITCQACGVFRERPRSGHSRKVSQKENRWIGLPWITTTSATAIVLARATGDEWLSKPCTKILYTMCSESSRTRREAGWRPGPNASGFVDIWADLTERSGLSALVLDSESSINACQ